MKIAIIGTGYVGMASAIGLAELGHDVTGYDIVRERIEGLSRGVTPYREAGIQHALDATMRSGKLRFRADLADAVADADFALIAVGTPSRDDGSADLRHLWDAVDALASSPMPTSTVVVVRSTVPAGTSDQVARRLNDRADVVYAPEFLREGTAVADFLNPDRIVVGAESTSAAARYAALFETLRSPLVLTTRVNAELIKGASNAYLAMKISFANEIANLSEALGADGETVLRGIGYDARIGGAFLKAGIGFGGPCFEKDCKSLRHLAEQHAVDSELISATLRVNRRQPLRIVENLVNALHSVAGREIAVWGLTFKAGTDDLRDSLAMRIVHELIIRGASVRAFDPAIPPETPVPPNCELFATAQATLDADALLILTDWPQFANVSATTIAARLRTGVVIDGRNMLDAERMLRVGLRYSGVGRGSLEQPDAYMIAS